MCSTTPFQPAPARWSSPLVVGEMNDMLSTALEIGTGKRASLSGWQIGGKTGTSQKARDALFIGYTNRMVTGVWLGNDDDKPTKLAGGTVPTQIWSDFMAKAHAGLVPSNLPDAMTARHPRRPAPGGAPAGDPIGLLTGDGEPVPADGRASSIRARRPLSRSRRPKEPRSARNIGDLLGDLFGG